LGSIFLPVAVVSALLGSVPVDHQSIELRYHGSLTKTGRDAEATAEPVKRFDLYCLATPQTDGGKDVAFVIDEHGGGGWPWPARFGRVATDAKGHPAKIKMRLLHEHNGTQYVMFVPFPYFEFADRLATDARWEAPRESEFANQRDVAPWKYRVAGSARVGGRDCWRVDVTNNFGPQESVWIEKSTGLMVKAERRIVIGRGETHSLRMVLDSAVPLSNEVFERVNRPLPTLIRLQEDLKRPDDEKSPDLTEAQLGLAAAALKTLQSQADATPFEQLVAAIERDVNTQSRRTGDVDGLARRIVGKSAPAFQLKSTSGEIIPPEEYAGKIVLLHFWSYQGDPFPPEPYGQVGFLDYLSHRRSKLGVRVYGVAVDRRLADGAQTGRVLRSVKKLQEFMNLTYPIATDDGTILEKFGDPERIGAKLPLWVLIDPAGTVVEYKVGNYEIKADSGLSELDKKITTLIRKQRQNRGRK
jgi:peroxiredoxin